MGKKLKTGKNRLDKYYQLAKQQGYRARSAFKLIQLAQRNDFFSNCRVLLDLCAAPGGWLQVAQKNMPVASHIVGVDLAPIRPIHSVVTIQADITSPKCRSLLKAEFKNSQVDVVLHDGAPNVGTTWIHDAYAQNELVLHAARLASEFLRRGGVFVTKVFRSNDYLSVLWMCQQLFSKVIATKPSSSRNISAELFFICLGYKKPDKVDPCFFDPRHIFLNTQQLTETAEDSGTVKTKRSLSELIKLSNQKHRQGYNEGDDYREASIKEYLHTTKLPAEFILSHHKLTFDKNDPEVHAILNHSLTSDEIIQCCQDLKVLSKRDIMVLIKWRNKILKELQQDKDIQRENVKDQELCESLESEESDWDEKLEALKKEQDKKALKNARLQREKANKLLLKKKMSLGAFNPVEENPELFRLSGSEVLKDENQVLDAKDYWSHVERLDCPSSDSETDKDVQSSQLDVENKVFLDENERLKEMAEHLDIWEKETSQRRAEKEAKRQCRKDRKTRRQLAYASWNQELLAIGEKRKSNSLHEEASDQDSSDVDEVTSFHIHESEDDMAVEPPTTCQSSMDQEMITNKPSQHENELSLAQLRTQRWFDQPVFKQAGIVLEENSLDEDMKDCEPSPQEDSRYIDSPEKYTGSVIVECPEEALEKIPLTDKQKQKEKRRRRMEKETSKNASRTPHMDDCEGDFSVEQLDQKMNGNLKKETSEKGEEVPMYLRRPKTQEDLLEVQTLGCLLARKRTRLDLIDGAYNRYAFDDDEAVPEWFLRDEAERMRPTLPVTKELMREYRAKLLEISRRPIRKVLEAKQRKKQKLKKRLEKTKKQAEGIASSAEHNEMSKASTIRKLVQKTMRGFEKTKNYVTSRKKGGTSSVDKGKKGSNGRVCVVDKRLKKDKRGKAKKTMRKRMRR